jgi:hypothetical protein
MNWPFLQKLSLSLIVFFVVGFTEGLLFWHELPQVGGDSPWEGHERLANVLFLAVLETLFALFYGLALYCFHERLAGPLIQATLYSVACAITLNIPLLIFEAYCLRAFVENSFVQCYWIIAPLLLVACFSSCGWSPIFDKALLFMSCFFLGIVIIWILVSAVMCVPHQFLFELHWTSAFATNGLNGMLLIGAWLRGNIPAFLRRSDALIVALFLGASQFITQYLMHSLRVDWQASSWVILIDWLSPIWCFLGPSLLLYAYIWAVRK